MEIKVEKLKPTVTKLHFKVFQAELSEEFLSLKNKSLATISQQKILQKNFSETVVTSETLLVEHVKKGFLKKVMDTRYQWALKQVKFQPLSTVHFDFNNWDEKSDFEFSAWFEVVPEILEVKIEKLSLPESTFKVTEAMIDAAIENIRKMKQAYRPVVPNRPIAVDDFVTFDVEAFQNGSPSADGSSKNMRMAIRTLKEQSQIEQKLMGSSVGQTVVFDHVYENNFPNQLWAGISVTFKVRVNSIDVAVLPELNADFIRSVFIDRVSGKMAFPGLPKTVEDLRTYLKEEIQFLEDTRIFSKKRELLLNKLVQLNPVAVPESLLTKQVQSLVDSEKHQLSQVKTASEVEIYLQNKGPEIKKTAQIMVQSALLVDFLASKNKLICSADDIEDYLGEKTRLTGEPREKLRLMLKNPTLNNQVKFEIVQDKVVNFIFDQFKHLKSA